MPGDHGHRHAIKVPADRRFRRIEIAMRIEPNDTAVPMVEAREYALADIAASGQYQGKLPRLDGSPDNGCESLAHSQGRVTAVAKRLATVNLLHAYDDTLGSQRLLRPGPQETLRPLAWAQTLVAQYKEPESKIRARFLSSLM